MLCGPLTIPSPTCRLRLPPFYFPSIFVLEIYKSKKGQANIRGNNKFWGGKEEFLKVLKRQCSPPQL